MEFPVLDPFRDYDQQGYLRNVYREKNLRVVGHLETAAFEQEVLGVVRFLRKYSSLNYSHVTETHRRLFSSLYPWAGQDRSLTAPDIAIAKAGYATLFAHPADVQRATEYALTCGQETQYLRSHPGEVFGCLAHAHPFLEGNGRTILTVFSELCRRAGFFIEWSAIDRKVFLSALTDELLQPDQGNLDRLLVGYQHAGTLSAAITARRLRINFRTTG